MFTAKQIVTGAMLAEAVAGLRMQNTGSPQNTAFSSPKAGTDLSDASKAQGDIPETQKAMLENYKKRCEKEDARRPALIAQVAARAKESHRNDPNPHERSNAELDRLLYLYDNYIAPMPEQMQEAEHSIEDPKDVNTKYTIGTRAKKIRRKHKQVCRFMNEDVSSDTLANDSHSEASNPNDLTREQQAQVAAQRARIHLKLNKKKRAQQQKRVFEDRKCREALEEERRKAEQTKAEQRPAMEEQARKAKFDKDTKTLKSLNIKPNATTRQYADMFY